MTSCDYELDRMLRNTKENPERTATTTMPRCTRKGCGKEYEENAEEACVFHEGGPVRDFAILWIYKELTRAGLGFVYRSSTKD